MFYVSFIVAQKNLTPKKAVGSETVSQEHVDLFHKLFNPYLDSFAVLQSADDLDDSVRISTGSLKLLGQISRYKGCVEKQKLTNGLHVRSIERAAKELLEEEKQPKTMLFCKPFCKTFVKITSFLMVKTQIPPK